MDKYGYNQLCIVAIVYMVLYMAVKIAVVFCLVLSTPVYVILCKTRSIKLKNDSKLLPLVVETVFNIIINTMMVLIDFLILLVQKIVILVPFIFLIIILSFINSNSDSVLKGLIETYNKFVVKTSVLEYIRKGSWILKILFEIFTPIYNFIIDSVSGGLMEVLRLLIDDDTNRKNLILMVSEFGNVFVTIGVSVSRWIGVNFRDCQYNNVVEVLIVQNNDMFSGFNHECFDHDRRDIDLITSTTTFKTIFASLHTLVTSLCPTGASLFALVFYPIYDENVNIIVHNLANVVVTTLYTTWDVTQLRCRAAHRLGLSTSLCVPDLHPIFRYATRGVTALGALVDNWANIAHMLVLSFFLDRDVDSIQSCKTADVSVSSMLSDDVRSFLEGGNTRIIPVSESLLAITNGNAVVYFDATNGNEISRTKNAFGSRPVDLKHGLSSIDFSSSILESDETGDTRTAIFGCRCEDNVVGGVTISCSASLFNGILKAGSNVSQVDTQIPIVFETNTNRLLMMCDYLRISVEPITFPSQTIDVGQDDGKHEKFSGYNRCMEDPQKCNNVDALIYVMPLCPTPSAGIELKKKVQCIKNSLYQTCFPYCVGLHQKGSATTPITLYNKKTLSDGVYMANSDCSSRSSQNAGNSVSMTTRIVSKDYNTFKDYGVADFEEKRSNLDYVCTFSQSRSSVIQNTAKADVCTEGTQFCANTVVQLQESSVAVFNTYTDFPVPTMLAVGQPYLFAGNQLLTQECELDGSACVFTSTVQTITSDIHSQYRILETLTNIPSLRASFLEKERSVHGGVLIPHDSMDVFGSRNPSAQTRTGIVYGVNPNLIPLVSTLSECSFDNKRGSILAVECVNCYKSPRIFFTQPLYKCSSDIRTGVRMTNTKKIVRACKQDTTMEIKFEGNDAFWKLSDGCDLKTSNSIINLFIEDITYLNDMNVIVTIKRGPINELLHLSGLNRTEWPSSAPPMKSASVYYFLNLQTYKVRQDIMWAPKFSDLTDSKYSLLCSKDTILPKVGAYIALTAELTIKTILLIANSYILNLFGIMEGIISKDTLCNGRKLNHYALDNCNHHPLSMAPLNAMWTRMDRSFDSLTFSTLRYFGILFGLEASSQTWLKNVIVSVKGPDSGYSQGIISGISRGAMSGMSVIIRTMFTSVYSFFFIIDEIMIKYIVQQLENKYFGSQQAEFVFFSMSNLLFDSIASGTMKSSLLGSQYKICQEYSEATGDAQSPIGKTVFHTCVSIFEMVYAAIKVVSSTITLSALVDCTCDIDPKALRKNVDIFTNKCEHRLPSQMRLELYSFLQGSNKNTKHCSILMNRFRDVLLQIPTQLIIHMDAALKASADVPLDLMKTMNIDRTDTISCNEYDTSLEVVTIVPRPISFFKKCAYIPSCRSKCQREINWFESEKFNTVTPNRKNLRGDFMGFIPAWTSKISGLTEVFQPLAVQEYDGTRHNCKRYIVVLGRPLGSGALGQNLPWTMYFFCYEDTSVGIVLLSQKVLESTGVFAVFNDVNYQNKYLVQEIFLVPMATHTQGALVMVYSEKDSDVNSVLEIVVDSGGAVHTNVIFKSDAIKSNFDCGGFSASIITNCQPAVNPEVPYMFVESATDPPMFRKIVILPGEHPYSERSSSIVPYTILAVYDTYIEHIVLGDDTQRLICHAKLEMRILRTEDINDETSRSKICETYPARVARQEDTITHLLTKIIGPGKNNAIVGQGRGVFIAHSTGLQRIEFVFDNSTLLTFKRTQLYSLNTKASGVSKFLNYAARTSLYTTSRVSTSMYAGILLRSDTNVDGSIVFTLMECDNTQMSNTENWVSQYTFSLQTNAIARGFKDGNELSTAEEFKVVWSTGIAVTLGVKIQENCNYMSCQSCQGRKLKNFCSMAQKCAIVNCVGTVVNPNNVFCVMGTMVKEYREILLYEGNAIWFAAVEVGLSIMRIAEVNTRNRQPIDLEGISNILNTKMCESKDLLAVASAFLPALVMTIYTSVIGNKQGFTIKDIGGDSRYVVRQIFSPGVKLENTAIISAVTQAIYQVVLGVIMWFYRNTRLVMCAITRFAEFSGGYINIVNHNIGDTDFCTIDNDFTENPRARTDESIIQERITSGAVGDEYTEFTINNKAVPSSGFTFDSALSVALVSSMERIMFIVNMNAIVDYSLGVIYSLARLLSLVEDDKCKPSNTDSSYVLQCACGDTKYHVNAAARDAKIQQGSLWCTGIQKHVNMEGNTVFVYNPFSLSELALDLHTAGQEYIDCITVNNAKTCSAEKRRVFLDKYNNHFTAHLVSPLAILNRCRENFHAKTWDEGIFGAFHPALISHIVNDKKFISAQNMQAVQSEIDIYLAEDQQGPVHTCLRNGPSQNRIQACMFQLFTHKNYMSQNVQDSTETSIYEYFLYAMPESDDGRPMDACEFLSTATFQNNADVAACQNENDMDGICSVAGNTECKIIMSTLSYEKSIQRNIVDALRVSKKHSLSVVQKQVRTEEVLEKYRNVASCSQEYFRKVNIDFSSELIDKIIGKLDLNLKSGEGDLLHQHMDCVFLGAYNKTFFAPTDSNSVLEPIMYSRHKNGESREFELPCKPTLVYDTYAYNVSDSAFLQKTCGSNARIGLMAYAKKSIVKQQNSLNLLIAAKIKDKIKRIEESFSNIGLFGCEPYTSWEACCAIPGKCTATESTFEPSIPGANFEISGSELLSMLLDSIKTIQRDVLYDSSVSQ